MPSRGGGGGRGSLRLRPIGPARVRRQLRHHREASPPFSVRPPRRRPSAPAVASAAHQRLLPPKARGVPRQRNTRRAAAETKHREQGAARRRGMPRRSLSFRRRSRPQRRSRQRERPPPRRCSAHAPVLPAGDLLAPGAQPAPELRHARALPLHQRRRRRLRRLPPAGHAV
eukprot:scaffold17062_cov90-Isochrysis_galbana.AAC.3